MSILCRPECFEKSKGCLSSMFPSLFKSSATPEVKYESVSRSAARVFPSHNPFPRLSSKRKKMKRKPMTPMTSIRQQKNSSTNSLNGAKRKRWNWRRRRSHPRPHLC